MYRILISTSLVLGALSVAADTAQDYFHRGAQYYIWAQKQKATNEIFTGLSLFPTDPQLNGLAALLKKDEEQQQKQNQNQDNQQKDQSKQDQNQQQQGQQNQDQQKQDSSKQDQQNQQTKQDQQQQQAAQQAEDQEKKQQPSEQSASEQKEQSGETNEQAYAAGQMTPEQARQLLDAQKGDEKMLSLKPEGKPTDRSKPIRDW